MNHSKETIQKKLSKSYFILVGLLLFFSAAFILPTQLRELNTSLEKQISWTGYVLSQNPDIIDATKKREFSDDLKKMLAKLTDNSNEIDYIVIVDTDSTRIYHPTADFIGKKFKGGDEDAILNNPTPYITTRQGAHDVQKRSFHQIQDSNGNVLGFIMVSASLSTVRNAQMRIIIKFLLVFLFLFIIGIIFATYTARHIRHILLGYEPADIAKMFIQREEILENVDEGILAYDLAFNRIYSNSAANNLLGASYELDADSSLADLCKKCLAKKETVTSIPYEYGSKTLLLSIMLLSNNDKSIGFLIMLRDRTETLELAEQLTGSTHIVEALRASTHEFLNKLHIISGMLQMENYDQAITFIDGLSQDTQNSYQSIIQQIQNKTIAALLLGKQSHARELGIDFSIQKNSCLDAHNDFLSTQELVTIIGNLVENAFHAIENRTGIRQVELFINQADDGLTIISDDTGCGMTELQITELMNGNFTTRGEGHGVGFRLIREIINKHNGYLSIDSEPDVGSSFTISIQKKRHGGISND